MRTRIKICGITRQQDTLAAIQLGVDALGYVFYPPSSRALELEQARTLNQLVPAFITRVALFLNPEASRVQAVVDALQPDLLQFHGTETPEFCSAFGRPYIKALALGRGVTDIEQDIRAHIAAVSFLFDSHSAGEAGGTGSVFDWQQIPRDIGRPLVLAGGLTPDNVADAVRQVRPYAVDVSSGVESAPGIKDAQKMQQFVEQVRQADGE